MLLWQCIISMRIFFCVSFLTFLLSINWLSVCCQDLQTNLTKYSVTVHRRIYDHSFLISENAYNRKYLTYYYAPRPVERSEAGRGAQYFSTTSWFAHIGSRKWKVLWSAHIRSGNRKPLLRRPIWLKYSPFYHWLLHNWLLLVTSTSTPTGSIQTGYNTMTWTYKFRKMEAIFWGNLWDWSLLLFTISYYITGYY